MPAQPLNVPLDAAPDAVVALLRAANVVLPDEYYGSLSAQGRTHAFTVSRMAGLHQIQSVADSLARAIQSGQGFETWRRWAIAQPWALERMHAETVYRNAVQTAYMAGHWRRFEQTSTRFPYLMYDAINDSRTRPAHLAMDGVIRPVQDGIWKRWSPPCGHRCRCTLRALTREQAARRGGVTQALPAEGGPDEGWGADPREWGPTLERLEAQRISSAPPVLAAAAKQAASSVSVQLSSMTPEQQVQWYIERGAEISATLPDGATDPVACHEAIMALLAREVGTGATAQCASTGRGAQVLALASQRLPAAWTAEADKLGKLYAVSGNAVDGWHITMLTPPPSGWLKVPVYGPRQFVQGEGYMVLPADDIGTAVHEFSHRVQFAMPELDRIFQHVHQKRTAGQPLKLLDHLLPGEGYAPDEVAREDHYHTPYQGKEYNTPGINGPAREVMPIAIESMLGVFQGHRRSAIATMRFRDMYAKDREMFDLTLGLLRHWKP